MIMLHRAGVLFRLLLVLAGLGLALPEVGPLLDHHFNERLHDHQHLYFGSVDKDHHHRFQSSHRHSGAADPDVGMPVDIGFFPSQDGSSPGITMFGFPVLQPKSDLLDGWTNPLLMDHSVSRWTTSRESVPPLLPPPRS